MELIELCHIRVTVQSIGMCGCDKEFERLDCCEKASGINLKFNGKTKVKEKGKYMNEKFFDLKKEKQDRMINAALKIFAKNGYRHASTDDMVAEAGISKGLLFHYFENKLGLYTFLYNYSVRFMVLELSGCGAGENDFFKLIKRREAAKMQALKKYPYMQLFIDSVRYEEVAEALCATEEKKNVLPEALESLMKGADTSRFKPEVKLQKLNRLIEYTLRGMMEDCFLENSFQPDMMYEEINSYLLMLKKLTYQ